MRMKQGMYGALLSLLTPQGIWCDVHRYVWIIYYSTRKYYLHSIYLVSNNEFKTNPARFSSPQSIDISERCKSKSSLRFLVLLFCSSARICDQSRVARNSSIVILKQPYLSFITGFVRADLGFPQGGFCLPMKFVKAIKLFCLCYVSPDTRAPINYNFPDSLQLQGKKGLKIKLIFQRVSTYAQYM